MSCPKYTGCTIRIILYSVRTWIRGFSDGQIFADALLIRAIPLEHYESYIMTALLNGTFDQAVPSCSRPKNFFNRPSSFHLNLKNLSLSSLVQGRIGMRTVLRRPVLRLRPLPLIQIQSWTRPKDKLDLEELDDGPKVWIKKIIGTWFTHASKWTDSRTLLDQKS